MPTIPYGNYGSADKEALLKSARLYASHGMTDKELIAILASGGFSDADATGEVRKIRSEVKNKNWKKSAIIILFVLAVAVVLALTLVLPIYEYYNHLPFVAENGQKFYLDKPQAFQIQDERGILAVNVNLSKGMKSLYANRRKELVKGIDEKFFTSAENGGRFWDNYWKAFVNTTEEDLILGKFVDELNRQIDSGTTGLYGKDAKAVYATRLVQNFEYDRLLYALKGRETSLPYETFYDKKGVCRETAVLLAKILKLQGYGAAVVQIPKANHAVAAVKCEGKKAVNGYCIIETTGTRAIGESDYKGGFWGAEPIDPKVHFRFYTISDGDSFTFDYKARS